MANNIHNYQLTELERTKNTIRFCIQNGEVKITNHKFLTLLEESSSFRSLYNTYLAECDFEAFYWENKPIAHPNLDEDYECILVKSEVLAGKAPDPETFEQYFAENKLVISFPNLGNDARLVVPCPQKELSVYTHIGNFTREADEIQIDAFWKRTATETLKLIDNDPKWLSTSGLGVFWLHARIDTNPKYYQTEEYKQL